MPKTLKNKYDKKLTYEKLMEAHIKSRKGKGYRKEIIEFNLKQEEYIMWLLGELQTQKYKHGGYTVFYVTEPKLRKIEKEIKEKEGILIILSNNKNKSLLKSQVIINMDFNQELINQYKIYEEAIIINAEENIKIEAIRFNGIVINDYEIEIGRKEFIWRDGIEKYRQRDLIEAELYVKDTYKNIRKKIQKNSIKIKELYGINGIVRI